MDWLHYITLFHAHLPQDSKMDPFLMTMMMVSKKKMMVMTIVCKEVSAKEWQYVNKGCSQGWWQWWQWWGLWRYWSQCWWQLSRKTKTASEIYVAPTTQDIPQMMPQTCQAYMLKSYKWIGLGMNWAGNLFKHLFYEHCSAVLMMMMMQGLVQECKSDSMSGDKGRCQQSFSPTMR